MKEKVKEYYRNHKWAVLILSIALCVILVSSFFASMIQSAGFSVKVTELNDVTNTGTLSGATTVVDGKVASGILFMPKSAKLTSRRPGIVLTHGYLNNKELQLQNAIELGRRGFIVLTIDRGGHGDNELTSDTSALMNTAGMYDAAKYLYNLPECSGEIGISGHSMGGMTTASVLGADNSSTGGLGIIKAGLIQGYNPSNNVGPNVSVGLLKAKDDEFFFKSTLADGTPTICREYLQSVGAANFVKAPATGTIDIKNGEIYVGGVSQGKFTDGTRSADVFRVIYEADEIHPINHWSIESAEYVTNFFYTAFGVPASSKYIAESKQTWWVKEAFSLLGLLGFFALAIPLVDLLLSVAFFATLKKKQAVAAVNGGTVGGGDGLVPLKGVRRHVSYWVAGVLTTLFSGLSARWVMTGQGAFNMSKVVTMLFSQNRYFPQDTTGRVASWAIVSGLFAVAVVTLIYIVNLIIDKVNKSTEATQSPFAAVRIEGGVGAFLKTLLLGALVVFFMYVVAFINWGIWTVDFRFWTFDIKVFEVANMLPMMIRYMVPFFIYFAINSILNQGYKAKNLPEWATIAINAAFSIFGILLVMIIQYATFRSTGVLWQADMNLNYIVLFPIIPVLIIATIYSRRLYERTGNPWLGAIVNTIMFTIITCANTASSFVSAGFFA